MNLLKRKRKNSLLKIKEELNKSSSPNPTHDSCAMNSLTFSLDVIVGHFLSNLSNCSSYFLFAEIRTDDYTYYLLGNRMSKWTAEIDCNLLQKGETSVATIPNNDAADVIGDAVRLLFQNFENYSTDLTCTNVINLGVLI